MLYTFIALCSVLLSGVILLIWDFNRNNYSSGGVGGVGVVFIILSCFGLLIFSLMSVDYISAGYKADLINKQFGTHYTQAEVFYGGNVIDQIQQLNRKRVEINGDLLKDSK